MKLQALIVAIALSVTTSLAVGCDKQPTEAEPSAEAPSASANEVERPRRGQSSARESETDRPPRTLDDLPEGVNAVQNEMRVLNSAMHEILTLIANDNLEAVPAQIKTVHPARQLTMKAIERGQYEPPRNADKMQEFETLDDAFHDDLKALIAASKNDDLQAATDSYADLVHGCTNCHTKFRFQPGPGTNTGSED